MRVIQKQNKNGSDDGIKEQIHAGRRKKLRARFIKDGLGTFNSCEVLEFALGFGMPRIDTNPIAHRLINKFGSLANVVNANPQDLMDVPGMGENSATFISFVKQLSIYIANENFQSVQINSIADAIKYLSPIMNKYSTEVFLLVCLDKRQKVVFSDIITDKELDKVDINIREVTAQIVRNKAASVIIAHNHLTGKSSPSMPDVWLTQKLIDLCCTLKVDFVDHIIFSGEEAFSFAEKGMIDDYKQEIMDKNAQY